MCNNAFASIVVKNGLDSHMLSQSPELFAKIDEFKNCHERHELEASGEEEEEDVTLDRNSAESAAQVLASDLKLINEEEVAAYHQIEGPKALGDILEAIIGAVFLDSGHDLNVVW